MPTNTVLSAMTERSTADDTQSRSADQRALHQAIRFPLDQTMQLQFEAARLLADSLESGSAIQQRGLSLATDLVRNYARTLERTTRDTGAVATGGSDAIQSPAIGGGQQSGTQQASQQMAQPTTAQQQTPAQQQLYRGQQQPQYEQQAPSQSTLQAQQQYEQQPQQTTDQPLQRAPPQQGDQSAQTPERRDPSITQ